MNLTLALGLIETVGLTAAVEAADTAVKSADVKLIGYELAKGDGMVMVKIEGDVGAVKAAIQSAEAAASCVGTVYSTQVIPRPAKGLDALIFTRETVGLTMPQASQDKKPETAKPPAAIPAVSTPAEVKLTEVKLSEVKKAAAKPDPVKKIEKKPEVVKPVEEKPVEVKPEPVKTEVAKPEPVKAEASAPKPRTASKSTAKSTAKSPAKTSKPDTKK